MRLIGICLLGVATLASCQKTLEEQVREQIRTADNAELNRTAVEVQKVRQSGSEAVAEVTIKTAVRMRKQGNQWILDEVRLGDRRWEKIDRILRALDEDRATATRRQMDQISQAIRDYVLANGKVPQVESFEKLVDLLCPGYLHKVIRIDHWLNPFYYQPLNSSQFELRSAGPDGRLGTTDDLVTG